MKRKPPVVDGPLPEVLTEWIDEDKIAAALGFSRQSTRVHLDEAGLTFRKIGWRRFYRATDYQHFMETGHAPARRRPRTKHDKPDADKTETTSADAAPATAT